MPFNLKNPFAKEPPKRSIFDDPEVVKDAVGRTIKAAERQVEKKREAEKLYDFHGIELVKDSYEFVDGLVKSGASKDEMVKRLEKYSVVDEGKIIKIQLSSLSLISLPKLPDTLQWLDCFDNQLTSLPELPDSLQSLKCPHNRLTSLPELPDSLRVLDCFDNKITSLPELPDSIQNLNCSHNRLTLLPELPNSLEQFRCGSNQLTEESKDKIKKHPNYNPEFFNF